MKVYEDKYLREKITRIIAWQKEGKIIIAPYKDGSGLLTRDELGLELTRAPYPYDYAVGKAGFLTYEPDIGAYVFSPAANAAGLPDVLVEARVLTLAEAVLDAGKRRLLIQCGETAITFTGIHPWRNPYEIVRDANEELARQHAGVVIWKLIPGETNEAPGEHLFPQAVPELRNGQALAHVTGFATDGNNHLVYVGLVGYRTALESIRVTLQCSKPLSLSVDRGGVIPLIPLDKYEQVWQAMPEYACHHAGFISRQALSGKWEPEDHNAYILVFHGAANPMQEMLQIFVERLKEVLEIPILDEWGPVLWKQGRSLGLIQELNTGGDCLRGIRLDLKGDWPGMITELLSMNEITLN